MRYFVKLSIEGIPPVASIDYEVDEVLFDLIHEILKKDEKAVSYDK